MTALRLLGVVPTWHENANCRQSHPDSFYSERGYSADYAKAVCRRCEVKTECLQWALDHGEQHGVWGGKTEHERRALKKNGTQAEAVAAA